MAAIQFNLLPDVKLQYLKTKRLQRVVIFVSTVACIVAGSVFVLLFSVVYGVQKKNIADLNKDIKQGTSQLNKIPDLDKILTIQNQMKALPALHDKKIVSSRIYAYISQVTPVQATITKLNVDFLASTLIVSGDTDSLATVNKYVDTLKFTKYGPKGEGGDKFAFSEVVLSQFSRGEKEVNYEIKFKFETALFSSAVENELTVPNIISTRSQMEKPNALFEATEKGQ